VTLAATLGSLHTIPVAGLVLLLGVDRFLNEARAITNLIGNGLATIAVAKWEGAFDEARWREVTGDGSDPGQSTRPVQVDRVSDLVGSGLPAGDLPARS
jgi:Na+/H+-dicarboxylate symporter